MRMFMFQFIHVTRRTMGNANTSATKREVKPLALVRMDTNSTMTNKPARKVSRINPPLFYFQK